MAFNLDSISQHVNTKKIEKDNLSFLKKEIVFFNTSFSNKVKEDFYTELGVLLKAGVSLKEGLELIQNSQKKSYIKQVIKGIIDDIVSGQSLSDSLKSNKQFSDYEYYSIKIGEETGTLALVNEQLGAFYAKKNEQRRNLISSLTYPVIILTTATLVVAFMLTYVVPMFQDIFKQQGVELPAITKFIISISEFMKNYGLFIVLALLILIGSKSLLNKDKRFKQLKDRLVLRLPIIGGFVKTIYLSQFTQAVSLLTASKVPVVNSIQLVKQMIDFYPLKQALERTEYYILQGEPLSKSLSKHHLFDDKMIALVKVAEETNQTEFIFDRLNMQYSTQVQQKSKMLSTVMEPFIILIVGVLVGIILIAMYLPMFRLSSVMG